MLLLFCYSTPAASVYN